MSWLRNLGRIYGFRHLLSLAARLIYHADFRLSSLFFKKDSVFTFRAQDFPVLAAALRSGCG